MDGYNPAGDEAGILIFNSLNRGSEHNLKLQKDVLLW